MNKDLLRRTEKLIRFKTTHNRPRELKGCAKWIKKELTKNLNKPSDVKIQVVTHNGIPSILAVRGKWKTPDILLNGHFDVVPAKPKDYTPVRKGDRLYGRGAADMKAGVASLITAFINALNSSNSLSLGLMLTGDEESGGTDGVAHLVKNGWKTKLLVNFDGGYGEEISHAEKGIMRLQFEAKGKTGSVQHPWEGDSALEHIIEAYNVLHEIFPDSDKATEDDNWYTTFTPKSLKTKPNANAIIYWAELKASVHFTEDTTPDKILSDLKQRLPKLNITNHISVPRVFVDPKHPDLLRFQKIFGKELGHKPTIRTENGSSDARFFSQMKIPMIITKPLSGNPEQDHEWVSLSSITKLTQALENFLLTTK